MIKLSMKVIARYLVANPSDRREVLRKQKYVRIEFDDRMKETFLALAKFLGVLGPRR